MTDSKIPDGHPMDPIAEQFNRSTPAPGDMPVPTGKTLQDKTDLLLSPGNVEAPAFFVDRELSVRWVAGGGQDPLSRALTEGMAAVSTRNAFNLLIRESIKAAVSNWQSFFSFVYGLLKASTSSPTFESRTRFLGDMVTSDTWEKDDDAADSTDFAFAVSSRPIALTGLPDNTPARIFGLGFPAGTLFVIRPDRGQADTAPAPPVEAQVEPVRSDSPVGAQSICVLAALLSGARQLADTMLPDVFVGMMHEIHRETDDLCRALGGRHMASRGAKLLYMFTANAGRDPIFSAINCALRLNAWIQKRQDKNSARQGWCMPLALKIGISHGKGRFDEGGADIGDAMFIPGGAADQSLKLAAFAKGKEIWITRDAMAQLPRHLVEQLVWGVDREGRFQQHFFARLGELRQNPGCGAKHPEIDILSVARIFKIRSTAPDGPVHH